MQKSRKGTKLNDAQYFRQPLPHTRKRMTKLRILPTLTDKGPPSVAPKIPRRFGFHASALDREQPSREMTRISYTEKINNHETVAVVEKPPEEDIIMPDYTTILPVTVPPECEEITSAEEITVMCKYSAEKLTINEQEDVNQLTEEQYIPDDVVETVVEEKIIDNIQTEQHKLTVEEKNTVILQVVENKYSNNCEIDVKEEKTTSWWRIIVDFFGFIVGRRESNHEKRSKKKKKFDETTTIVTAKPENPNIHEFYINSVNKDKAQEHKAPRTEQRRYCRNEKLMTRQMSSPLY